MKNLTDVLGMVASGGLRDQMSLLDTTGNTLGQNPSNAVTVIEAFQGRTTWHFTWKDISDPQCEGESCENRTNQNLTTTTFLRNPVLAVICLYYAIIITTRQIMFQKLFHFSKNLFKIVDFIHPFVGHLFKRAKPLHSTILILFSILESGFKKPQRSFSSHIWRWSNYWMLCLPIIS